MGDESGCITHHPFSCCRFPDRINFDGIKSIPYTTFRRIMRHRNIHVNSICLPEFARPVAIVFFKSAIGFHYSNN